MANFVSILALRPQEQYEKKKVRTLKDELPKSVGEVVEKRVSFYSS